MSVIMGIAMGSGSLVWVWIWVQTWGFNGLSVVEWVVRGAGLSGPMPRLRGRTGGGFFSEVGKDCCLSAGE